MTWPTRSVATPASFATRRRRPAASRTCDTEPGADPTSGEWRVCTESTTQTAGRSWSSVAQTTSRSVSARISTRSQPPSRCARSFTCATDSSPVTRSARRSREIAPSAVRRSVDLPTPGSPPTSTSDAGTSPPPRTRSSSGTPVEIRSASSTSTSTRRRGGRARAGCVPRAGADSATSVPNSPQPGQRPSHRPEVYPHSVHACWTAATFAMRSTVRTGSDGSRAGE